MTGAASDHVLRWYKGGTRLALGGPPPGATRAALRQPADPIRCCTDVQIPTSRMVAAAAQAVGENADNAPRLVGVHEIERSPLAMAIVTSKKWEVGRRIRIAFMDGSPVQRAAVKATAPEWCKYGNFSFEFDCPVAAADARISFRLQGAWCFIGTDALSIPKNQPTMNFGFYDHGTILHEFGHLLGCIHEHQHPDGGIPWNKEVVYKYFAGAPNFWTRDQVDVNLFERYGKDITQFSAYDRASVMHYPVDRRMTTGGFEVGWNKALSETDKNYIATVYPGVYAPTSQAAPAPSGVSIPLSGTFRVAVRDGRPTIVLE